MKTEDVVCGAVPMEPTTFPIHERIAAYWFLVSAFEHVNRVSLNSPSRGDSIQVMRAARFDVLDSLPSYIQCDLAHDDARHDALADRRRYLMQLESRAGAK